MPLGVGETCPDVVSTSAKKGAIIGRLLMARLEGGVKVFWDAPKVKFPLLLIFTEVNGVPPPKFRPEEKTLDI